MTSTAESIEDPRFPAAFADMQIQQGNCSASPKPRVHHTRSRTVSHQKDYLDPAVMAVVVEAAAAAAAKDAAREREIDMYYPPSGELEPSNPATATMRPRSASATLLSPVAGDQSFVLHRDRSVKSLTQRLTSIDIDRLAFQDSKSANCDEDHKFAEKTTETIEPKPQHHMQQQQQPPPPPASQQVQVHKNGHRENYKSYPDDCPPPPQKYPTGLANAKSQGMYALDMGDLDTSILDFKLPELKEPGLAPSARHITMNPSSGTTNLILPLPDQR